jgi:hypothetical protein
MRPVFIALKGHEKMAQGAVPFDQLALSSLGRFEGQGPKLTFFTS